MLIIYAHPNRLGHCGEILKEVVKTLKSKNVSYEILDLYQMQYDPVLKPEEHYTSGHNFVSQDNKAIQEKIKNSKNLIFIYPTWWNGMPAILKGFIDRVFVSKFAFIYEGAIPKKLLKGRKAAVFTSTGAIRLIGKFYKKDRSTVCLSCDVLEFCGIRSKSFIVDKASKFTDSQKIKIKKVVNKGLRYLL